MRRVLVILGILCVLLAGFVLVAGPAPASHGQPFPLTSHSDNALRGEELQTGMTQCGMRPVYLVKFNLYGRQWVFAVGEAHHWIFMEYVLGGDMDRPVRVWIGYGSNDKIVPDRHIEDPAVNVPAGPCSLVYPKEA